MNLQLAYLFYLFLAFITEFHAEPLVKISQGFLNGTIFETRNGRNVSAFIGIPYGQPTSGNLRFSNPLPAKPWHGILSVKKEANACPQDYFGIYLGDEDCLYLNVFTPLLEFNWQKSSIRSTDTFINNLLPVMVYVHGGGFNTESTNLTAYSPKYLMDRDIVFVSMNFRLGVLSFLTTGDSVSPGNFGLKDQVLALKWVQKNIQAFGGDSNRITVFGNSAGGACVNLLALSDSTNDLFHQYIIQSGVIMGAWGFRNKTEFKPIVNELARKMGCSTINSTVLIKCLREKSVEKVVNTASKIDFSGWLPSDEIESDDAFLTDNPLNLLARNKMKDLPFITGTTADEGLMATLFFYLNRTSKSIIDSLEKSINFASSHYLKSDTIKFRNLIKDYYFNEANIFENRSELLRNFTIFASDSGFFYPQMILFDKMAKTAKNPFFFYSFGYRGNTTLLSMQLNVTENFGVFHAEELLYLFPKGTPKNAFTKTDERIIDLMVDLWTSFAKKGKPTSYQLDDPNSWLPFSENGNFLQIGSLKNNTDPSVTLEQDFFGDRMNFWKKNFPML